MERTQKFDSSNAKTDFQVEYDTENEIFWEEDISNEDSKNKSENISCRYI